MLFYQDLHKQIYSELMKQMEVHSTTINMDTATTNRQQMKRQINVHDYQLVYRPTKGIKHHDG